MDQAVSANQRLFVLMRCIPLHPPNVGARRLTPSQQLEMSASEVTPRRCPANYALGTRVSPSSALTTACIAACDGRAYRSAIRVTIAAACPLLRGVSRTEARVRRRAHARGRL